MDQIQRKKIYVTWTNAARRSLIIKRIAFDELFNGKNANSNEGWKKVAEDLDMGKDWKCCKSQWNMMVKKYKKFFHYKTGEGTGEEAVSEEAKDWEFFELMHEYASKKDNYHPPFLLDSGDGEISMRSGANRPSLSRSDSPLNFSPGCSSSSPGYSSSSIGRSSSSPGYSSSSIGRSSSSCGRRSMSRASTPKQQNRDERLQELQKHIYKRDRKLNKRIGSLLSVFGQMVKTDYPNINVDALLISSASDSD